MSPARRQTGYRVRPAGFGVEGGYVGSFSISDTGDVSFAAPVPEPSTYAALGAGLAVILAAMRRRQGQKAVQA